MIVRPAAVVLLLLFSTVAQAQEGLGLDLTEEGQKKDAEKPPEDEAPPKPARASPTTAAPKDGDKAPAGKQEALTGERDITQDDRVKSVQRKVYLKRHRVELNPAFAFTINDPLYSKLGVNVRAAFYLADTLALAGRFALLQTTPSDDVPRAKALLQSRIFFSVPYWMAMGDLEWSPLYGKVAFFNSILHFDGYIVGGMGAVNTETAATRGVSVGADLGLGMRFVAKDFVAVNVSVVNTTYVDQPAGTTKGSTQNVMLLNVGLSLFIPFSSTGKEGE